jgi:UDP-N-acetylmuramoyl-L-alanyl-D-glutamate--2,6-diaminopimelate ligase
LGQRPIIKYKNTVLWRKNIMKLDELTRNVNIIKLSKDKDPDIKGIAINSKKTGRDFLFAAIPGFKKDGHEFISEAISNGACAIMMQKEMDLPAGIAGIIVEDCRKELALICRNFFNNPSGSLMLSGITGTNGKTTSVFLIDSIFKAAGFKTSYISTVKAQIGAAGLAFDRTTPDALELNEFFQKSRDANIEAACMEVSSHSIDLHRVDWLDFDYFVFTNLTQDHLDYHESMENYFKVKSRLFTKDWRELFGGKGAIINIDDPYGLKLCGMTDLSTITFGINNSHSNISAENIRNSINGIEMNVKLSGLNSKNTKNLTDFPVKSLLCGYFNIYNILGAIGLSIMAGIDIEVIRRGILSMAGVNGRFEKVPTVKKLNVIVDYAHTPDGLENVLKTAKSLKLQGGRLISVFGCGGDRDKKKREIMGGISARLADFTIITSDNPRSEDPDLIISMIEEGFKEKGRKSYEKIPDRKQAIIKALEMSGERDIVLVAGKGHEDYQEFADRKIHFSDQEVVREWDSQS